MPHRLETGFLLVVEGIDGAGKTTQVRRMVDAFTRAGLDCVGAKEPTDGPWGQIIRRSARDGRMTLEDELDAFVADRREHVRDVLGPALDRGAIVVLDRYYYSTAAYQGARGADPAHVVAINEAFAPRPHLLAVIDVEPSVGRRRVQNRDGEANLFEDASSLAEARAIFLGHADAWGAQVIDGGLDVDAVTRALGAALEGAGILDHVAPTSLWTTRTSPDAAALAVALAELRGV